MPDQFRWWFEGKLTVHSPLRIGDGGTQQGRVPDVEDHGPIEVNTVFTDVDGRAYLPGSTLKGVLRAALSALDPAACQRLFGFQADNEDDGSGGEVEFWDARLATVSKGLNAPFYNASRGTAVSAHTAIDRRTKTAAHNKLFYFEYVPAGAEFTVRLSANSLTEADAATLLSALQLFQNTDLAPRLGAHTPNGWGSVSWQSTGVYRLGPAEITKWLAAPVAPMAGFRQSIDAKELLSQAPAELAKPKQFVEFPMQIRLTSFFLVNDPSRGRKQKRQHDSDPGNLTPLITPEGAPYLPASSLRGALRSQAERIHRTMHPDATFATVSPRGQDLALPSVRLNQLDLVCRLFGAPGWRSPLSFLSVLPTDPGLPQTQDFVAIDRFTGGGADALKFDADSFYRPAFATTLRVDAAAFARAFPEDADREAAWLLLGLTLRDFAQGDISLGYGTAKGYGSCEVAIEVKGDVNEIPETLQARFARGFGPASAPRRAGAAPAVAAMSTVRAGADEFFNPYQFAPVAAPNTASAVTTADLAEGKLGQATHDRYVSGTHSGRILCTLTAETPIFVGARRDASVQPARLSHYHLPGSTEPAIPATSLRGLISSIAESASRSALRVLHNPEVYSYRNPAAATGDLDKIPTAIGMVVRRLGAGGKPQLYLKPLCLPTFKEGDAGRALLAYKPYFTHPVLKTYVGWRSANVGDEQNADNIESTKFESANPNWQPGAGPAYRKLSLLSWNSSGIGGTGVRRSDRGSVVLEQKESESGVASVPGVIRALGCGPTRDIAGTKTHELFIRFPEVAEFLPDADAPADLRQLVLLPDNVVNRFHRLADEMTSQWRDDAKKPEDVRPYEPRGTRPNRRVADPEMHKLRLVPGDLVYFRLESKMGGSLVAEVSFSSIWRKEIAKDAASPARCHDFFAQISPDLLPLGPQRLKGRASVPLTPVELLFGVVEDRSTLMGEEKLNRSAFALAGRLRFSAGIANGPITRLPEKPLRILSSPKPPSPSMYFQRATPHQTDGDFVGKPDLKLSKEFLVRGRKFYLHHGNAFSGGRPWVSNENENMAQKVSVSPVDRNAVFHFHVDFDNLSSEELNLLLYSLRPSPAFRHKLGLGKPLGLGSVRIDVDSAHMVARTDRYSLADFLATTPRWAPQPVATNALNQPALERIGSSQVESVSYPLVSVLRGAGQPRPQENDRDFGESQHYPWFVATDVGSGSGQNRLPPARKALKPLRGESPTLEPLSRLEYRPPRA